MKRNWFNLIMTVLCLISSIILANIYEGIVYTLSIAIWGFILGIDLMIEALEESESELKRLKDSVNDLLFDLYKAPRMHAYTREAFVAMVSTIIICSGVKNFSSYDFYTKYLGVKGSSYATPTDPVDNEWAQMVIDCARDILLRVTVVKIGDNNDN